MEKVRKPFLGVGNIVRFNWHFYVFAGIALVLLFLLSPLLDEHFRMCAQLFFWLATASIFISLFVSYYIYDVSGLYHFPWLNNVKAAEKIININAGFDETSVFLADHFKHADLLVLDFYDPAKHTEVSIKRARRAYPAFPGTQTIQTTNVQLEKSSADVIFMIFAAHEIRNEQERIAFFKSLNDALKPGGQIFITEHLRDLPNFFAYNIGFFHFHSKASWLQTFKSAGFSVHTELKYTPFISTFILQKNAATF